MEKKGAHLFLVFFFGHSLFFNLLLHSQEHLQKGMELFQAKRFIESIEALKLALKEDPENEGILFQLGLAQFMTGQFEEAKVSYQEALRLKPDMWEGHFNLALLLYDQRKTEEALQHFLKAQELNPKSYQSFFFSARTLELLGRREEAMADYLHALQNAASDQEKGECHLALARLALTKKDFPTVEKELGNARQVQADPATLEVLSIQYFLEAGFKDKALELLKKRISSQPDDARSHELMARLYSENSNFMEAARSYQLAANHEKDLSIQQNFLQSAAQAYQKGGDIDSAIEILTRLAANSKDPDLFLQIGSLYMHQRKFEQAEKIFNIAVQLKPDCASCWSNLGSAFLLQEKHPQALDCLIRFSKLSPQTAGTYFYMATIYDKYGDTKNAMANYQKFLDLDQGKTEKQDFQARQRIKTLENRLKRR